ncbi:hypothetical protein NSQ54_17350 [Alkalihalobacillus sp. FSL W8-0930]
MVSWCFLLVFGSSLMVKRVMIGICAVALGLDLRSNALRKMNIFLHYLALVLGWVGFQLSDAERVLGVWFAVLGMEGAGLMFSFLSWCGGSFLGGSCWGLG